MLGSAAVNEVFRQFEEVRTGERLFGGDDHVAIRDHLNDRVTEVTADVPTGRDPVKLDVVAILEGGDVAVHDDLASVVEDADVHDLLLKS
jgi:hypothetical protein